MSAHRRSPHRAHGHGLDQGVGNPVQKFPKIATERGARQTQTMPKRERCVAFASLLPMISVIICSGRKTREITPAQIIGGARDRAINGRPRATPVRAEIKVKAEAKEKRVQEEKKEVRGPQRAEARVLGIPRALAPASPSVDGESAAEPDSLRVSAGLGTQRKSGRR